ADHRSERLVHVDYVVVPGTQLAPKRDRPVGEDGEVRDGTVGTDPQRAPERDQIVGRIPKLGLGAVQAAADGVWGIPGSENADVLSPSDELLRQCLNMPVHPSLVSPGVGR